jgi:hypothetical protein
MDGRLQPLLPYLQDSGFDGIEGATPQPQESFFRRAKRSNGDMILIDGIPMLLFLSGIPNRRMEAFAKKLISLFSPNLILGISDEISPQGDIEKVRFVSKLMEKKRGGGESEKK